MKRPAGTLPKNLAMKNVNIVSSLNEASLISPGCYYQFKGFSYSSAASLYFLYSNQKQGYGGSFSGLCKLHNEGQKTQDQQLGNLITEQPWDKAASLRFPLNPHSGFKKGWEQCTQDIQEGILRWSMHVTEVGTRMDTLRHNAQRHMCYRYELIGSEMPHYWGQQGR